MSHDFDDEEFIALISPEIEEEVEQQINLAAERQNRLLAGMNLQGITHESGSVR